MQHNNIECENCGKHFRIGGYKVQYKGKTILDEKLTKNNLNNTWTCPICNQKMLLRNAKRHVLRAKQHNENTIFENKIKGKVQDGKIINTEQIPEEDKVKFEYHQGYKQKKSDDVVYKRKYQPRQRRTKGVARKAKAEHKPEPKPEPKKKSIIKLTPEQKAKLKKEIKFLEEEERRLLKSKAMSEAKSKVKSQKAIEDKPKSKSIKPLAITAKPMSFSQRKSLLKLTE